MKERLISSFIHSVVKGFLSKLTYEDVKRLIENNEDPFEKYSTFVDSWTVRKLLRHAKEHQDRVDEYLSYENVLVQSEDHYPELLPLFRSAAGRAWCERNLAKLKEMVLRGD